MGDSPVPVRSYQRIFSPERRIYQIDGRRLPVPGGVRLSWLGWFAGTLAAVLVLGSRSLGVSVLVALAAGALGGGIGDSSAGVLCGAVAFTACMLTGLILGALDWPLKLVVLPVMAATLAEAPTPDGRPAHRYALSWLALRLGPARRSAGRPLAVEDQSREWAPVVWVSPDERSAVLRRGRVRGPARLEFAAPVVIVRRRGRHVVRPAAGHRLRRGERLAQVVEVGAHRVVEVRP